MPPIDPDNTPRAYVTYTADSATHTLMVRCVPDATDEDVSTEIGGILSAIGDELSLCTFVKFERSLVDSNVRVPAVWSGPSTWGAGDPEVNKIPWFWSFTGKDVGGHKARVDFFGRHLAANQDYRVAAADNIHINATLVALRTAELTFVSITGSDVIWNDYANESISQHWVGEARK